MKTRVTNKGHEAGNVLVITIILSLLIGSFVAYYLNLVRTQNMLVARSQGWNASLALAEAGAEEALAHLNPGAPQPSIDRAADGWGGPSGGFYGPVSRTCGAGSYSVLCTTDTFPVIYSTGYVTIPALSATIARTIRVNTTNSALHTAAMAAKLNIDFNGNGIMVNSFNSADPNLSSNGFYTASLTSTNGDVASIGGLVNVANGSVYGNVLLGPTASDSIAKNGLVTGGIYNDFNVEFWDVVLPPTTWSAPSTFQKPASPITKSDGVAYDYVFDSTTGGGGDIVINSLNGNLYVGSNTTVRLLIHGNSAPNYIRVDGSTGNSGNLTIYMDGATFALGGSSTINSGNATNFTYLGTTNNTAINFGGNANFTGTIYAPEADFKLGGGGSTDYDFVGASVTKTVTMTGHYKFHYDENLGHYLMKGYVATSWTELPPPSAGD
jgi:hypothetical protein